jgi:hypothetical protein
MRNFRKICSNINFEKDFEIVWPPKERPLLSRLVDCALTGWLFCSATFGMVVGALWALGYVEMWMVPRW